jgi:hypothetical protein
MEGCVVALNLLDYGFFFCGVFRVSGGSLGKSYYDVGSRLCVHRKCRRVPITEKGK